MKLLSHPLFRPILGITLLVLLLEVLKMQWFTKNKVGKGVISAPGTAEPRPLPGTRRERLVVAHFMLGNTYPFTEKDWEETFDLAEETSLDALSLNLGPEEWQLSQAQTAYSLLSRRQSQSQSRSRLKLFLSLDMNVLPADPQQLAERVVQIVKRGEDVQLRYDGGTLLSTFGGHQLGDRWNEVIGGVEVALGKVTFFPAFFLPPEEILAKDYVHGAFNWNGAWPMGNHTITLDEDRAFLQSKKPYMAAISPLFFTHYGTEGQWAWNKNWIYRSDDLLLPTRFNQFLSLPIHESPEIIQIISWNDYGESHYIAPVLGAQPGSERWTSGMGHEGFRWLVSFFARRWRDGMDAHEAMRATLGQVEEADEGENLGVGVGRVVLWYRTQSRDMAESTDSVAKPDHSEWAQDLLNFFILFPPSASSHTYTLQIHNGPTYRPPIALRSSEGEAELVTAPFVPGHVGFEVLRDGKVVMAGTGRAIEKEGEWNYNMWSGVYK